MRYLFLLLSFVVTLLPLRAQERDVVKGAHITFEQTEHDFGEVSRKGEDKSYTFRFTNDGTEPLVVLSAVTSCSCIKTDFSRKPIGVGESGEIRLVLESKKMEKGVFHRIVQIRSTSITGTEILTVKGVSNE